MSTVLKIIASIVSFFMGRKEAAGVVQGRTEQRAADAEANLVLIRKANIAAKQEEGSDAPDPNDRANRG